jgi:hypothetical protein
MGVTGVSEADRAAKPGEFCAAPKSPHMPRMWGIRCAAAPPRHCERSEAIYRAAQRKNGLLPPSLFELRRTSRCARNDVRIATLHKASYPRRRVSSTPRPIDSIINVSGILDRPPARTMTAECVAAFSRRICARGLHKHLSLPPEREQGMPGARCTRGLVCNVGIRMRTRAYRYSRNTPAFPAQWFDGLCRALPGDEFVLPPSLPA